MTAAAIIAITLDIFRISAIGLVSRVAGCLADSILPVVVASGDGVRAGVAERWGLL